VRKKKIIADFATFGARPQKQHLGEASSKLRLEAQQMRQRSIDSLSSVVNPSVIDEEADRKIDPSFQSQFRQRNNALANQGQQISDYVERKKSLILHKLGKGFLDKRVRIAAMVRPLYETQGSVSKTRNNRSKSLLENSNFQ